MWERHPAAIPQPLPVGAGSLSQSRVTGGGGREARVGAPFGRGLLVFPVSRHPSPATRLPSTPNVEAPSRRDSSALGRGRMPLPQGRVTGCRLRFTVACTPCPVTRNPSPVHSRKAGTVSSRGRLQRLRRGGERQEAGDEGWCALRARPFLPVSRNPSPVHSHEMGGGRRGSGGEGRCALRARPFLSRLPSPVSRPCLLQPVTCLPLRPRRGRL